MRALLLTWIFSTFFTSFNPIQFNDVVSAISAGNSSGVAKFFDSTVEISLPQQSYYFSKKQAELVLSDFFNSNTVKSFEVIHKSEKKASQYCIGNLNTNNGLYRTTIFMKQIGDKQLVQELRFEK